MWWQGPLGVIGGLALVYLALLFALWQANRDAADTTRLRAVMRLLPDIIRLLRRHGPHRVNRCAEQSVGAT